MKNKECYENELVALHFVALLSTNMMPVYYFSTKVSNLEATKNRECFEEK